MVQAFRDIGAATVVAFNGTSVSPKFASDSVLSLVRKMIGGATVKEAVEATWNEVGKVDPDGTPSTMEWRGNDNLRLESTGVANGGFENGLAGWTSNGGDARVLPRLGALFPMEGQLMAVLSSGLGQIVDSDVMVYQDFKVPPNANTLSLVYDVVSEEPLEFVGNVFDDRFEIRLFSGPSLAINALLASESVNTSSWTQITGAQSDGGMFDGGDDTAYRTGRKLVSVNIAPYRNQRIRLRFHVFDVGDSLYDTAALIDGVRID
jgi:hypothetical protein